jgi:hypothetical protein
MGGREPVNRADKMPGIAKVLGDTPLARQVMSALYIHTDHRTREQLGTLDYEELLDLPGIDADGAAFIRGKINEWEDR